jgi:hypothetical protein
MASDASAWEPARLRELRADLGRDPAVVEAILATLSMVPEPERVLIRTDAASVDRAIARALALIADGVICRLELIRDGGNST